MGRKIKDRRHGIAAEPDSLASAVKTSLFKVFAAEVRSAFRNP